MIIFPVHINYFFHWDIILRCNEKILFSDETVQETEVERGKESQSNDKKKVWKENENRWCHDRYNEDEQTPKSRDELVAVYGYDIRNEEAPPRARRRRRYGYVLIIVFNRVLLNSA